MNKISISNIVHFFSKTKTLNKKYSFIEFGIINSNKDKIKLITSNREISISKKDFKKLNFGLPMYVFFSKHHSHLFDYDYSSFANNTNELIRKPEFTLEELMQLESNYNAFVDKYEQVLQTQNQSLQK